MSYLPRFYLTHARLLRNLLSIQLSRCNLIILTAALCACGGGGGGGNNNGTTPPDRTANPNLPSAGNIVFENSTTLGVLNLTTLQSRTMTPPATNNDPGLGVSRNGVIADVNGYSGSSTWNIDVRSLDLNKTTNYTVGSEDLLSFPTSAAALNADATMMAYSVNEMRSVTDDTRIDRIYVANLVSNRFIAQIDGLEEPVFIGNELLARDDNDRLFLVNSSFSGSQDLNIEVSPKHGAYNASPDGRYIAYDSSSALHSQITVFDRNTGNSWLATDTAVLGCWAPVFSPDGKWLAFLVSGSVAGTWLHIIPFEPGATRTINRGDTTEVKTAAGDAVWINASYGWTN